ncbi:hypothetical protein B0H11DRAFT_2054139 [Mycena galericulata]|nr:hypothetical protein B0H11DRAFT_2054139 [Mycena galericulata]
MGLFPVADGTHSAMAAMWALGLLCGKVESSKNKGASLSLQVAGTARSLEPDEPEASNFNRLVELFFFPGKKLHQSHPTTVGSGRALSFSCRVIEKCRKVMIVLPST